MFSKYYHKKSVFLYLLLAWSWLSAQDHHYIQYTTTDGLPTNYVYGVIEDNEGYIWAYTENGISKFDGYTFTNFTVKDGLPTNDVVEIYKDKKTNRLFLHPYKSHPTYIEQDSIVVFSDETILDTKYLGDRFNYTYERVEKRTQELLFYENDTLVIVPNSIDSFMVAIPNFLNLDSVRVRHANWQNQGNGLILATKDSLYYYATNIENRADISFTYGDCLGFYLTHQSKVYWSCEGQQKVFSVPRIAPFKRREGHGRAQLGKEKKFLFNVRKQHFYILDIDKESLTTLKMPKQAENIRNFHYKIYDSTFVIGHHRGFMEYDFEGNLLDALFLNDLSSYYTINTSFKDSKGNVWMGSREGGLFFIPKLARTTSNLSSFYAKDKAFEEFMAIPDNQLLAVTSNVGVYHINDTKMNPMVAANKETRLRSMVEVNNGVIISGSRYAFFAKNKANAPEVTQLANAKNTDNSECADQAPLICCAPFYPEYYKLNDTRDFAFHPQKEILYSVSYRNTLIQKKLKDSRVQNCTYLESDIPVKRVYYHPYRQKICAGNNKGIYELENNILSPVIENDSLFQNISSLFGTPDNIWIGTESNGLFRYTYSSKALKKINAANYIRQIRPDTDSTLLIASNEGILILLQKDGTLLQQYSMLNGLLSNEIQDAHFDKNKYIYVASSEGLQCLDRTTNMKYPTSSEDLNVKSISAGGKHIAVDSSLQLAHTLNDVSIHYHLMSFASNKNVQYFTKLTPLESNWQPTQERSINYLDLSPGNYTFHLKAQDIYSNEVTHLPIKIYIKPPFWKTIWFRLLLLAALVALIALIIRYLNYNNQQKLKKEKAINRKMAELELSALRAQMNPHFVFNALGAIQYHIQINEVEEADSYLTSFAKLMRKYLDSSKERMITLQQEIELLSLYTRLEQMRFEDLFKVSIHTHPELDRTSILVPSMMIQPFIENAVNHGLNERRDGKGQLHINFYEKEDILHCEIKDNGIGRENAKKNKRKGHKSRGMSIIGEKVETLRQSEIADISIKIDNLYPYEVEFPGTYVIIKIKNLEDDL